MSSLLLIIFLSLPLHAEGWIRHNQLGYLPQLIRTLRRRGYSFVPLQEAL